MEDDDSVRVTRSAHGRVRVRRPQVARAGRLFHVDQLRDSRNLRFHDIYHADDWWINALFVGGFLVLVMMAGFGVWPFQMEYWKSGR